MKILALETSTLMGSVSLVVDGKVVAHRGSRRQKSHSEVINQFVDEILSEAKIRLDDIDFFAVGKGPGSFTGLRIAGNIGKSFAFSFNKPMIAIDSLTLLAAPCPRDLPILAMINAYKNMVYFGLFKRQEGNPELISGPGALPVKSLGTILNQKCLVVGDGFSTYRAHFPNSLLELMVRKEGLSDDPDAISLGVLAYDYAMRGLTLDWKSYIPLYIRASEAEESKRGIFIPSL